MYAMLYEVHISLTKQCLARFGKHQAPTLRHTNLTPKAKLILMVPRMLWCFERRSASNIANRCFTYLTKGCFAMFGEHQAPTLPHMNLQPKAKLMLMVPRILWCFEWCGASHISNRCFTYLTKWHKGYNFASFDSNYNICKHHMRIKTPRAAKHRAWANLGSHTALVF